MKVKLKMKLLICWFSWPLQFALHFFTILTMPFELWGSFLIFLLVAVLPKQFLGKAMKGKRRFSLLVLLSFTLIYFQWTYISKILVTVRSGNATIMASRILLYFEIYIWNIFCLPHSFRRPLQRFWDHRSKLNPKFRPQSHGMWTYMLSRMHHSSPLKCEIKNQYSNNPMLIIKSILDMVVKITGEIRYATMIAKIQLRINKTSFIRPLK